MQDDPRQRAQGYFAGMPLYMKVLAPLSVIDLSVGLVLDGYGYPEAWLLISPIMGVIVIRVLLTAWFLVGPQSIIGYTLSHGITQLEVTYPHVRKLILIPILVIFVVGTIRFANS